MLVKDGSKWVLIDAGAPDGWSQRYASMLVADVKKQLPRKTGLDTILRESSRDEEKEGRCEGVG